MGTINYRTVQPLTMGVKPYDIYDLERDNELMNELQNLVDEYGSTLEGELNLYIEECYNNDLDNINSILSRYSFLYYHVSIEPGYYEGFYLDIESNFPVAFDSWEDKREVHKEITQLRRFLEECAGVGLVACYPGWCTGYEDYNGTRRAIKAAVKELRKEVDITPTWLQYERENRCKAV